MILGPLAGPLPVPQRQKPLEQFIAFWGPKSAFLNFPYFGTIVPSPSTLTGSGFPFRVISLFILYFGMFPFFMTTAYCGQYIPSPGPS